MLQNNEDTASGLINRIKQFTFSATVSNWWHGQAGPAKTGFLSALIIGFVSHLFVYTGRYYGRDDIGEVFRIRPMFGHGRWLNTIMSILNYGYIIPIVTGFFVTLFLAASAFLICKLFTVRNRFNAVLIAGLLTTFPSIANTNLFLRDSINYHFAVLLAVLAVYVTVTYRRGLLVGGFLAMLTLAIYQSKFNIIVALCLFYLLLQLLADEYTFRATVRLVSRFFAMAGIGGILYAVSVPVSLSLTNTTFSNYRGFSYEGMAERLLDSWVLRKSFMSVYSQFIDGFFGNKYLMVKELKYIYLFVIGLSALFFMAIVLQKKLYRQRMRFLLIAVSVFLIPFACNFSDFFDTEDAYGLMIYAFVLAFVFAVVVGERCQNVWPLAKSFFSLCMILVICHYIIGNNVYYLKAYYFNQRTDSVTTRVLARIDPLLAEVDEKCVGLFGSLPNEYYPGSSEMFDEYGTIDEGAALSTYTYIGYRDFRINSKFVMNVNLHHGLLLTSLGDEDTEEKRRLAKAILDSNMPAWPEEGCVGIIDGIIIVNFGQADVVLEENNGEKFFRARHYISKGHLSHSYEYHWQIYQNGKMINETVTDSAWLPANLTDTNESYRVTVRIRNASVGFTYQSASLEGGNHSTE